jgi:hypothetical protein
MPVRPENWVPVADVAPLALPLRTLVEEASRHALPVTTSEVASPAFSFQDLDRDDDATARMRAKAITMRAATAVALLLVAELRSRPRSEDQQRAFDHAMTVLAFASMTGVAPTLVLLLEGMRAERARGRDWCDHVLQIMIADERTRDDVADVREVLADGATRPVLTLSAERRAQLLVHEADDLESARRDAVAAQQWFANNRERLEELKEPST